MRAHIVDPFVLSDNDHHGRAIRETSKYFFNSGIESLLYVNENSQVSDIRSKIIKIFKAAERSTYTETNFYDYMSLLKYFENLLTKELGVIFNSVLPGEEIIIPNGTLPLLFCMTSLLNKHGDQLKSLKIKICMGQHCIPQAPLITPILVSEAIKTFKNLKNRNTARIYMFYVGFDLTTSVINGLDPWVKNQPLETYISKLLFPPVVTYTCKAKYSPQFDIVAYGLPVEGRQDYDFLYKILERTNLNILIAIPQNARITHSFKVIYRSFVEKKFGNRLALTAYDNLDDNKFQQIKYHGKFAYGVHKSYYSDRLAYSGRSFECLISGFPIITNHQTVQNIPFFDPALDAVIQIEDLMVDDGIGFSRLQQEIVDNSFYWRDRGLSRVATWSRHLESNSWSTAFLG
jgi:hypothetical protein